MLDQQPMSSSVLGKPADAARCAALFTQIRTEFNAKYLSADGVYRDTPTGPFTQTAQILPLAFGLVPDELRPSLAARLVDGVVNVRGGHEFVGILGARYLLPVLSAAGHADAAFTVATQTAYPSYGYWIETLGWTGLGEFWEPTSRSINHHFFGTIGQWMYEDLVGIRALEPGYKKIEFRPSIPSGLAHSAASYDSVRGRISARWRKAHDHLELEVTVPPNASGVVHVPATDPDQVFEVGGGTWKKAAHAHGVKFLGVEAGRVIYGVGSGTYEFRVRAAA